MLDLIPNIGAYAIVAIGAVVAFLGMLFKAKRDGIKQNELESENEDLQNAVDIRDRARDGHPDELRKHENSGFRD